MRNDPAAFRDKNLVKSRSPQFVAKIDFGSNTFYLTSSSAVALPPGVPSTDYKHGTFKVVSSISQTVQPESARSTIGSVTFDAIDVDAALTTEIRARLLAGEGLRGKAITFYQGYPGLDFADFIPIVTQVVDAVDVDGATYRFSCKDITREAQSDVFKEVSTTLGADLAVDAATMTVASTTGFSMLAHGTSYTDAASSTVGYLEIKQGDNREVMRYTGMTSNSFTGLTRGVLNTEARAFTFEAGGADNGVKVKQYVYLEMPALKLAYAVLTGELLGQDGAGTVTYVDADDQGDSAYNVWKEGEYVYLANNTGGLHVYSVSADGVLTHLDSDDQGDNARDVWSDGNFIYLANGTGGLHVYAVDGSGNLTHVDFDDQGDTAASVWGDGTFVYLANSAGGLHVYAVDGDGMLLWVDSDDQGDSATGVWGDGDFIYLANGAGGLHVYSVSAAGVLTHVDFDDQGGIALGVWGDGDFIYLANGAGGLHVYSVSSVGVLTHVDFDDQGDSATRVWGDGHFIYLANGDGGLQVYSVSGVGVLTLVDSDDQGDSAYGVYGDGSQLYLANSTGGLLTYSVANVVSLPDDWHLGVDKKWVNRSDFLQYEDLYDVDDDTKGISVYIEDVDRQDGKSFIERELMLLIGCYLRVQSDGKIGVRRAVDVQPDSGYVDRLDVSNVVKHGNLRYMMSDVANTFEVQWNYNANKKAFTRLNLLVDAASEAIHGAAKAKVLAFRGLNGVRHSSATIQTLFDTQRDRYANPPIELSVTCLPSKSVLEVGDPVRVVLPIQDIAGTGTLDRTFEIQRSVINWITGTVTFDLFASSQSPTMQAPDPTSQIADAWYSVAGTAINAANFPGNVSSVGGLTTISGNITLTGTSDMNAAGSIFYVAEDCTIAGGVIVSVVGNVQLRVMGFLTINGDISGVGGGDKLARGYVGVASGSQAGLVVTGTRVSGSFNPAAYKQKVAASLRIPPNETMPYLDVKQDANGIISGIPTDMRGTGGQPGAIVYNVTNPAEPTELAGGAGGNGGAGLFIISRGGGFGGSGGIDLSGAAGIAGASLGNYHAGCGSSGGPGGCHWLLDGRAVVAPTLSANFVGKYGAVDLDGSDASVWASMLITDLAGEVSAAYGLGYTFVNGAISTAAQVDISTAAQRVQRVTGYVAPAADVDDAAGGLGLGTLATKNSVDLATAEVTNKTLGNIVDDATYAKVKGTAITSGEVDLSKAGVIGKTGANITYTVGGVTVDSLKPAAAGADVTSANTAAAITGQGALATKGSVDLATAEVTNKTGANITYTVGGVTLDSLKPAEASADQTSAHTAADTAAVNGTSAATVAAGAALGATAVQPAAGTVVLLSVNCNVGSGTTTQGYQIHSDGTIDATTVTSGVYTNQSTWLVSGSNSDYEVMMTKIGGTALTSGTLNTWLACDITRTWYKTGSTGSFTGQLMIRKVSTGMIIDVAQVVLDNVTA